MGIKNGLAWLEKKIRAGEEWAMIRKCACLSDGGGGFECQVKGPGNYM